MDIPANIEEIMKRYFQNLKKEDETWIRKIRKTN